MGTRAPLLRLALLCVLAAASSAAWSKPPAEGTGEVQSKVDERAKQSEATSSNNESQTNIFLVSGESASPQKSDAEAKAEADYRKKSSANEDSIADWTARLGIFTICLFIVAFAQAVLFAIQLKRIKQGLDHSAIAANAAKASADAASANLRLLDQTTKIELRAYVGPDDISAWFDGEIFDPKNGMQKFQSDVRIKNFGQTPATDVAHASQIVVAARDWPDSAGLEIPEDAGDKSVIYPGQPHYAPRPKMLTSVERSGLQDGSLAIYVLGTITYVDAFGQKQSATYKVMKSKRTTLNGRDVTPCTEGNSAT